MTRIDSIAICYSLNIFADITSRSPSIHTIPLNPLDIDRLLKRNETGRVGSTNTWATVLDWVVRDGEFSEVVANHLWLDLDLVELLSGVDTNDGTDHLWDDDHVTEVGLDEVWLLVWLSLLLCLTELLDEAHWLALKTAVETTTGTGMDDVAELVRGEVEELLEVDSTVGELLEGSLGLDGGSLLSVVFVSHLCGSLS